MPKIPDSLKRKPFTASLTTLAPRLKRLELLLQYLEPITPESVKGLSTEESVEAIEPIACDRFETVLEAWREALQWTKGLEASLTVMLACAMSTNTLGDQLWVKVYGPPSCGKTTLCEALAIALKYVKSVSTFRGFHSGYGDGEEDHSLISKLPGMTLLTKDGDTLLQSPNLGQILSEGRDAYDTSTRTSYRNRASKDYIGVRFTWILCGTASLRALDKSELGARFLDCVVMDGIDDDLEDRILMQVANRVERTLTTDETDTKKEQYEPALKKAMQLTGGYLMWLRTNAAAKLAVMRLSEESKYACTRFGKYVSYMRARPSEMQEETNERELAARLTSQHTKLAMCTAVVMNRESVDAEVLELVRKVAKDTARGQSADIAKILYNSPTGMEVKGISLYTGKPTDSTTRLLRFMKQLGAVEQIVEATKGTMSGSKTKWKLNDRIRKLMTESIGVDELGS